MMVLKVNTYYINGVVILLRIGSLSTSKTPSIITLYLTIPIVSLFWCLANVGAQEEEGHRDIKLK